MLPARLRLVREKDFSQVYQGGKRAKTNNLSIIFFRSGQNDSRFGFVVSKRQVHLTVQRNRIKRRVRAQIERLLRKISPGFDVVVQARAGILKLTSKELGLEIIDLLKKAKLLVDDKTVDKTH